MHHTWLGPPLPGFDWPVAACRVGRHRFKGCIGAAAGSRGASRRHCPGPAAALPLWDGEGPRRRAATWYESCKAFIEEAAGLPVTTPGSRPAEATARGAARVSTTCDRDILGVNVRAWSREAAIEALDARVGEGVPACVAFANTNLLNFAASDATLRAALTDFIVLNDGIGADIAARILYGRAFPCNLNGTDFVPAYLEGTVHSHRIFIIGAQPGVVERAAHALQRRFSGQHEIVGWIDGYSGVADPGQVLGSIAAVRASLLLVGMGCPRQERWMSENVAASGARLAFGVGALLDFTAGEAPRAPAPLRRLRLEWVYRLAWEPRRLFRRYMLEAPAFLVRVVRQR